MHEVRARLVYMIIYFCEISRSLYVGDIGDYRVWLRRKVIRHMIVDAGVVEKLYAVNFPKTFLIETLQHKRLY